MSQPAVTLSSVPSARSVLAQWRGVLLIPPSEHRRRLPRDVAGILLGLLLSLGAGLALAAGAGGSAPQPGAWGNARIVTVLSVLGPVATIAVTLGICAVASRWWLLLEIVLCGALAAAGCLLVIHTLHVGSGDSAGLPLVAATISTATLISRVLTARIRRYWWTWVAIGLIAQVLHERFLPLGVIGAAGIGLMIGSAAQLVLGTGDGFPTVDRVGGRLTRMGLTVASLTGSEDSPTWGAARFLGEVASAGQVVVDVYGRDVPEGQFMARLWRFTWRRRSTLELNFRPAEHVEHVVGILHWAQSLGVLGPTVLAASRFEPEGEAVLVTRPPEGVRLATLEAPHITPGALLAAWTALRTLDEAGIALRWARGIEVVLGPDGRAGFTDFSHGEVMSPAQTRDADIACLLVETARRSDAPAAVDSCIQVMGRDRLLRALPLVQPLVVAQGGGRKARAGLRQECALLREAAAAALDIEPVVPVPLTRVQPSRLVLPAATFLGIWLLIEQLAGLASIADVLKTAQWLWVLVALLLSQLTNLTEAISLSGTSPTSIPLGPLTLLRSATDFSGLVGGTAGRTTTIIRFYQHRGMSPATAVSSGVLYSLAGFAVQIVLGGIALLFAAGEFSTTTAGAPGSDSEILFKFLLLVVAVAFVGAIAFAIPRIRRVVSARFRPEMQAAWANLRAILADPAKVGRILGGQILTQFLSALALWAALHSVGGSASYASLIVLCTVASLFGGISPVPGGMGVMEATYISGLTLLGVPEDIAIGATLLYRLCTTYLPPIWGWASLLWLRRHEMV
jgi:uncharacterized membrane protein YbhN (UPF0104 family)